MNESAGQEIAADVVEFAVDLFVPFGGVIAKRMVPAVVEEVRRNRSVALLAAEEASGMSREDLAEEIAKDPQLVPLVTRLLYAAGMNGHDRVLRAMGLALGDAVRERLQVDECEILLTCLSDLTPAHIAILEQLQTDPPPRPNHAAVWTTDWLREHSTLPPTIIGPVVGALVSAGLAEAMPGFGGGMTYRITDLGGLVREVLLRIDSTRSRK